MTFRVTWIIVCLTTFNILLTKEDVESFYYQIIQKQEKVQLAVIFLV